MDISIQHKAGRRQRPRVPDLEELYIAVREYENKICTDAQLLMLPDLATREWEVRRYSSGKLLAHLQTRRRYLKILEVGCGNGWLSAKMADLPGAYVTGLDINQVEISQASRVFKKPNLEFIYDSFNENTFDQERFDVIVFAASLQYFPSVVTVLQQAAGLLNRGGEIHIIDTPFYEPADAAIAARRCREYYQQMGVPQMADHYFHHAISEFWGFDYKVLFDPTHIFNRVFKKWPFYWIAINK